MGNFERVLERIERGKIEESVPMGFNKLTQHVGLYKETFYLIGGLSGTGKTSLVSDAFLLNPYDWYILNKDKSNVKLKVFYFSMERPVEYMIAKWISRKIFIDTGNIISVNTILGRVPKEYKITPVQEEIVSRYEDYIDEMTDSGMLQIIAGPQNPMGIKKLIDDYARENGKTIKVDKYNVTYVPNNPHEIVLIIYDHIGKLKKEKREDTYYSTKKDIIDLASSDAMRFRDYYGYSPVFVSQFNRSISNPIRLKSGNIQPSSEDFKETSVPFEDCDVCMALFDPIRYKLAFKEDDFIDTLGFDLKQLRDSHGRKKYKSLHVLKNTYGSDDLGIGFGFQPVVGMFKELPSGKNMTGEDYMRLQDDSYFLM